MSPNPPTPPTEFPVEFIDELNEYSTDTLRSIAIYAEKLADYQEQEPHNGKNGEGNGEEQPEDLPEGVPSKATITIKEINNNRYYYWQWREGDKIKSEYKGPVESGE